MRENVEIRQFSVLDYISKMMRAVAGDCEDEAFQRSIDEIQKGRARFRVEKVPEVDNARIWIAIIVYENRIEIWIIVD